MKKSWVISFLMLAVLVLAGCSPATTNISSTSVFSQTEPATLEPVSSPEALTPVLSECQVAADRLAGWAELLPFEETALFPQKYQGQSSLNLWFMNPALTQASAEDIRTWAADSALLVLYQLSLQDDCILAFDNYFVTVVDPIYQVWFSGSFRPADLAATGQSNQVFGSGEVGGGVAAPTTEDSLTGGGKTCSWMDVANALNGQFVSAGQNSAFMLLRDAGGTNLSAYLTFPQAPSDEVIAQTIALIDANTGCLRDQLNGISITFTLPDFQLILTGYQPLKPGEGYNPAELSFTRFDVQ